MPTPIRPDIITLPNVYSTDEVGEFMSSLNTQLTRFGVKKLRKEATSIYAHLRHIQRAEKEMQRLLKVVNGQPTPAQHHYYEEKKARTAAQRFYTVMSTHTLRLNAQALGIDDGDYYRDALIEILVEAHVKREMETMLGKVVQDVERGEGVLDNASE